VDDSAISKQKPSLAAISTVLERNGTVEAAGIGHRLLAIGYSPRFARRA
jgi:hypothetical protein